MRANALNATLIDGAHRRSDGEPVMPADVLPYYCQP